MLWSLIKILAFVAIVALLAMGAGYLMEATGGVRVTLAGTEYTLGALQSVVALVVLVCLVWLALKLAALLVAVLKFLNGDETAISRYFDRGRERRGYQALAESLVSLASGEGRQAMTKAAKAEKLLQRPELTNLVIAQAAEMSGDTRRAEDAYKRLIEDPATRFVGVRGIMKQRLANGDDETARKLAEKALALKPAHEETQDVLLLLQTRAEDWAGARSTLKAKMRTGTLPKDVYRRRDAVLALTEARVVIDENASVETRMKAIEANKMSPDLVPAAAMAARSYIAQGSPRNAARLLKKAWEVLPHPDIAHAFAEIAPDETPAQRVKRFGPLVKLRPDHPESRLLMAELNIVAEDFPEARRALGELTEKGGDARAFTLMAAIERGEGSSDAVVQGWLARALTAPRGPQWVCEKCNRIHSAWGPVCERCGAFDTLAWVTPEAPDVTGATGAHMLPLIVRAIADHSKAAEAEETPEDDGEAVVDAAIVEEPDAAPRA